MFEFDGPQIGWLQVAHKLLNLLLLSQLSLPAFVFIVDVFLVHCGIQVSHFAWVFHKVTVGYH